MSEQPTGQGEAEAPEEFDETIVVAQPVAASDDTVVVSDETVVIARPEASKVAVVEAAAAEPVVVDAVAAAEETVAIARPIDLTEMTDFSDNTVVVAAPAAALPTDQPVAEASLAVEAGHEIDATQVVASTRRARRLAATPQAENPAPERPSEALPAVVDDADDATVVVAQPKPFAGESVDDSTVVVAQPRAAAGEPVEDATIVVAQPQAAKPDANRVGLRRSGDPAPPVEEPSAELSDAALAKLLFKPPLDPKRRIKESPFPQPEHTLPKRGVSKGMPVVYPARPETLESTGSAPTDLEQRLGEAPAAVHAPSAHRVGLPSAARLNRRFRALALGGGAGVCVVVALGLWGIGVLAFG